MKEATGELNLSVVILVGIAGLAAFFYFTIWPMIRNNMNQNTNCAKAVCLKCDTGNCQTVDCHMPGDNTNWFKCVWKG